MPVRCEEYNNVAVLSVEGDLSAENAAVLRQNVEQRIDARHIVDFVVDMEHSEFIDSEGLETLLWLKRRCDELFGQTKLVGVQENLRKILQITRLEPRFEIQADLTAALKLMG